MTYYRIAWRDRQTEIWIWKTTVLTSLQAVLQLLKTFRAFPQEHVRVFTAPSKEELNEMLQREKSHLASGSVTAAQFLQVRKLQISGQSAAAYSRAEPAVRQATTVATDSSLREHSATTDGAGLGNPNPLEGKRLEIECGPGGDHDLPHSFSLPLSVPQVLAWMTLLARVQRGELRP